MVVSRGSFLAAFLVVANLARLPFRLPHREEHTRYQFPDFATRSLAALRMRNKANLYGRLAKERGNEIHGEDRYCGQFDHCRVREPVPCTRQNVLVGEDFPTYP